MLKIHERLRAASQFQTLIDFYFSKDNQTKKQAEELSFVQFSFDLFVRDLDDHQGRETQASQSVNEQLLEFYKLSGVLRKVIKRAHADLDKPKK